MWATRKITQTRGQIFKTEQDALIAKRAAAVATVIPTFLDDVQRKIDLDRTKDIQQKVFVYNVAEILRDNTLYSKGYFEKAVAGSQTIPYLEELQLFANAAVDAAKNQDYEVRVGGESQFITIDFTNVATLAEARIAAEKIATEAAEASKLKAAEELEIAKKAADVAAAEAAKLKAVADKIAL